MTRAILVLALLFSSNAFAAQITDAQILSAVKSDSIALAAFKQASAPDCETEIVQRPLQDFDMFSLAITCTQKDDGEVGGGVYLKITISGQYWNEKASDVQKIEIMRAG